jgi:hypothetical protein
MGYRGRNVLALIGVLVLVGVPAWVAWEIHSSRNPVGSATVYAGDLAPVAIAAPLLLVLITWWWKGRATGLSESTAGQVAAAAGRLAESMLVTWRQEAKDRRISTPAPARVRWQWGPAQVTLPPAELIPAPAAGTGPRPLPGPDSDTTGVLLEAGVVTRLHEGVYLRLPHGRLVLTGGPGAGKTGAMILLLLAALDHRRSLSETQAGDIPVPVWLTLGGWDPTTQTLHHWAKATMYRDHPYLRAPDYGLDVADGLLCTGRVALFFDGLDEMARDVQAKALARIEQEGAGLRVVLSSRPGEYGHARATGRLHNTAVIEVQPVAPDTAHDYLLQDQIGPQRDRWHQVGGYLEANPGSVAARTLDNPLALSLARDTYQHEDPTALTDAALFPTVAALREHLIYRILITAYPDERQRAHATRWLAWIAHHMGTNRDLAWWHIPTWIPRRRRYLAVGCVFIFGFVLGFVLGLLSAHGRGLTDMLLDGLGSGIALGLLVAFLFGSVVKYLVEGEAHALRPRWPRPGQIVRLLVSTLTFALAMGLFAGFTIGRQQGLAAGVAFGLGIGIFSLPIAFVARLKRLWEIPLSATAATPSTEYRHNRRTSTVFALGIGLVFGLFFGIPAGTLYGFASGLWAGILIGLMIGSQIGLKSPAPLVALAQFVLAITGDGRVRFIRLLEDAHHRQVLRQAGAIYQFRHAELQEHLNKLHGQRSRSRT